MKRSSDWGNCDKNDLMVFFEGAQSLKDDMFVR